MAMATDRAAIADAAGLRRLAIDHARIRKRKRRLSEFFRHGVLAVITFVLVAPFYYVVLASLKDSQAIFSYPPKLIPWPPYWENYKHLVEDTNFLRWMVGSSSARMKKPTPWSSTSRSISSSRSAT